MEVIKTRARPEIERLIFSGIQLEQPREGPNIGAGQPGTPSPRLDFSLGDSIDPPTELRPVAPKPAIPRKASDHREKQSNSPDLPTQLGTREISDEAKSRFRTSVEANRVK